MDFITNLSRDAEKVPDSSQDNIETDTGAAAGAAAGAATGADGETSRTADDNHDNGKTDAEAGSSAPTADGATGAVKDEDDETTAGAIRGLSVQICEIWTANVSLSIDRMRLSSLA